MDGDMRELWGVGRGDVRKEHPGGRRGAGYLWRGSEVCETL